MQVYQLSDLPYKQLISSNTGELFSKSAILTNFFSFKKVFVHYEILLPGRKASSPHRHTTQEEMIVILDGFPTVHLGKESKQLKPGDFIGFKPSKEPHFIENTTDQEARFLVICSNQENDQIIFYS